MVGEKEDQYDSSAKALSHHKPFEMTSLYKIGNLNETKKPPIVYINSSFGTK